MAFSIEELVTRIDGNEGKEQQGIMCISHGNRKETFNRETGNRAWLLLL